MELFTLKKNYQLQWDDIPFIENPAFGREHALDAIRYGDKIWKRVTNIKEFVAEEIGHFNPCGNNCQTELKVYDLFHQGTYFSVAHHKPFAPAFTWKPDAHHPNQGEWVMQNPWVYPTSVKEQIDRITTRHKKVLAEAYLSELQATPFAIAQPIIKETPSFSLTRISPSVEGIDKSTTRSPQDETESQEFEAISGKYGSARNYGDYIVVNDVDDLLENHAKDIKNASGHQCYAVGETVGLPYTERITAGEKLVPGKIYPRGTVIATFVDNGKGELVYPSQVAGRNNYVKGIYGHLALIDDGGLSEDGNNLSVIHQYSSGTRANTLHQYDIQNKPQTNATRLVNQLDQYYVVKIKK